MTRNSAVLAFDLGASSGRAIVGELYTMEDGLSGLRMTEVHRFDNTPLQIGNHLHWDISRLLQEIKIGIRQAVLGGYDLGSFSIDTWGVDFGLLDGNGELLDNPYHYRDPHTDGVMEEVLAKLGKGVIFEQSGLQFMSFNTIYQLYAMQKAGSVLLQEAETLLMMPDLLMYLLTGVKASEFTNATTTQLFHPIKQEWNTDMMESLGIPTKLFLQPIKPGETIGTLLTSVCEELDVPPLLAVAVGSHDTASAVAAVPALTSPFAYLSCGTWSLLGTELAQPSLTPETLALEFTNEGGVNDTYRLLKNIMGLWLLQECKREWDSAGCVRSFAEWAALASKEPAFGSFIDPEDSRFLHPSGMPEKIRSFCRDTGQPVPKTEAQIVRCVMESLALKYRYVLERTEALADVHYSGLHMVGGGIQNEFLCQYTANAIARPVWAGPVEGSAIGNVLVQFMALGEFKSLEDARAAVHRSFPIKSYAPEDTSSWEMAYETFRRLMDR
ncbi:MAG: rhamnulokinase [Gorillibacterium sp.]|nr:rhamnulokinase [Gorillibacterium sp.]